MGVYLFPSLSLSLSVVGGVLLVWWSVVVLWRVPLFSSSVLGGVLHASFRYVQVHVYFMWFSLSFSLSASLTPLLSISMTIKNGI